MRLYSNVAVIRASCFGLAFEQVCVGESGVCGSPSQVHCCWSRSERPWRFRSASNHWCPGGSRILHPPVCGFRFPTNRVAFLSAETIEIRILLERLPRPTRGTANPTLNQSMKTTPSARITFTRFLRTRNFSRRYSFGGVQFRSIGRWRTRGDRDREIQFLCYETAKIRVPRLR
jgi:hypothetical protein